MERPTTSCSSCTYFLRLLERAQIENKRKSEALTRLDARVRQVESQLQNGEVADPSQWPSDAAIVALKEQLRQQQMQEEFWKTKVDVMMSNLRAKEDDVTFKEKQLDDMRSHVSNLARSLEALQKQLAEKDVALDRFSRLVAGRDAMTASGLLAEGPKGVGNSLSVANTMEALEALDSGARDLKIRQKDLRSRAFWLLANRFRRTRRRKMFEAWAKLAKKGKRYQSHKLTLVSNALQARALRKATLHWIMRICAVRIKEAQTAVEAAESARMALTTSLGSSKSVRERLEQLEHDVDEARGAAIAEASRADELAAELDAIRLRFQEQEEAIVRATQIQRENQQEQQRLIGINRATKEREDSLHEQVRDLKDQLTRKEEQVLKLEQETKEYKDEAAASRLSLNRFKDIQKEKEQVEAEFAEVWATLQTRIACEDRRHELMEQRTEYSLRLRRKIIILRSCFAHIRTRATASNFRRRIRSIASRCVLSGMLRRQLRAWSGETYRSRGEFLVNELEKSVRAGEAAQQEAAVWKIAASKTEAQLSTHGEALRDSVAAEVAASRELVAALEARLMESMAKSEELERQLAICNEQAGIAKSGLQRTAVERVREKDVRVRSCMARMRRIRQLRQMRLALKLWEREARIRSVQSHILQRGVSTWRKVFVRRLLYRWISNAAVSLRRNILLRYTAAETALADMEKERQTLLLELQAKECEVDEIAHIAADQEERLDQLKSEQEETRIAHARSLKLMRRRMMKNAFERNQLNWLTRCFRAFRKCVLRRKHADKIGQLLSQRYVLGSIEWGVRRWLSLLNRSATQTTLEIVKRKEEEWNEKHKYILSLRVISTAPPTSTSLRSLDTQMPVFLERLQSIRTQVEEAQEHFDELAGLAVPVLERAMLMAGKGTEVAGILQECAELLLLARAIDEKARDISKDSAALELDVYNSLRQSLTLCRSFYEEMSAASDGKPTETVLSLSLLSVLDQAFLIAGEMLGLREEVRIIRHGPLSKIQARAPTLVKELAAVVSQRPIAVASL